MASDFPQIIDGALAYAPGDYFVRLKKTNNFLTEAAKRVQCPVFITSAKNEQPNWDGIFRTIFAKSKKSFVPKTKGNLGSRALWDKFKDSKDYWPAVNKFLDQFFIKSEFHVNICNTKRPKLSLRSAFC